ncbi:hypothetical protein Tco_0799361 [Tanacetum coccineum]|uniref:Uncharacterized protein n=1 Tax=Tanacetum coccineum TaxID=301880 RepID=A0ABQ4ZUH9_9ASTR
MSSSSAPIDTKTISSTSGARGSPVLTPSPDDPYMLARQAYSPTALDTESEPFGDPSETEEPQLLSPTSVPPSPDYTPTTPHTDDESESFETSETRVTSSPSTTLPVDPTLPSSPQRPLLTQTSPTSTPPESLYYRSTARMAVCTQPTLYPGYSTKLTEAIALSPSLFHKRYRSSYETPSSSSSPASSPTLPLQKRYEGTSKLITDTETESTESEDEDTDSKDEETTPEGQQQAIPAKDAVEDEPIGLGYGAARRRALGRARDTVPSTYEDLEDVTIYRDIEGDIHLVRLPVRALLASVQTPPSSVGTPALPEWSPESPLASPVIPSPVASLAPAATLDEDVILEIRPQLELNGSVLHTHSEHLDALPPSHFDGYDWRRLGLPSVPCGDRFWHLRPGQGTQTPKGELCSRPNMRIDGKFTTCGGST